MIIEEGIKFYKQHNRLPSQSDSRRLMIGFSHGIPTRYFGSWVNYKKVLEKELCI